MADNRIYAYVSGPIIRCKWEAKPLFDHLYVEQRPVSIEIIVLKIRVNLDVRYIYILESKLETRVSVSAPTPRYSLCSLSSLIDLPFTALVINDEEGE